MHCLCRLTKIRCDALRFRWLETPCAWPRAAASMGATGLRQSHPEPPPAQTIKVPRYRSGKAQNIVPRGPAVATLHLGRNPRSSLLLNIDVRASLPVTEA